MDRIDHIVFKNRAFICLHCGTTQPVELPMPMKEFSLKIEAFNEIHKHCRKDRGAIWRQEATELIEKLHLQEIGKEMRIKPGEDISEKILSYIREQNRALRQFAALNENAPEFRSIAGLILNARQLTNK